MSIATARFEKEYSYSKAALWTQAIETSTR